MEFNYYDGQTTCIIEVSGTFRQDMRYAVALLRKDKSVRRCETNVEADGVLEHVRKKSISDLDATAVIFPQDVYNKIYGDVLAEEMKKKRGAR